MDNLVYFDGELYHSDDLSDDFLAHYGVKGMKWGRRKAKEDYRSGNIDRGQYRAAKKDLKRQRREYVKAKMNKELYSYNRGVDKINKGLDRLNSKYDGVNLNTNKKANDRYMKEYDSLVKKSHKDADFETRRLLDRGVEYRRPGSRKR